MFVSSFVSFFNVSNISLWSVSASLDYIIYFSDAYISVSFCKCLPTRMDVRSLDKFNISTCYIWANRSPPKSDCTHLLSSKPLGGLLTLWRCGRVRRGAVHVQPWRGLPQHCRGVRLRQRVWPRLPVLSGTPGMRRWVLIAKGLLTAAVVRCISRLIDVQLIQIQL